MYASPTFTMTSTMTTSAFFKKAKKQIKQQSYTIIASGIFMLAWMHCTLVYNNCNLKKGRKQTHWRDAITKSTAMKPYNNPCTSVNWTAIGSYPITTSYIATDVGDCCPVHWCTGMVAWFHCSAFVMASLHAACFSAYMQLVSVLCLSVSSIPTSLKVFALVNKLKMSHLSFSRHSTELMFFTGNILKQCDGEFLLAEYSE